MKIYNSKKLPVTAFLFNFVFLVIFPILYAYWMSFDKSSVFAVAGLLSVTVIGIVFFFVSLYALRFTASYFHQMASKRHTAMKCYTL